MPDPTAPDPDLATPDAGRAGGGRQLGTAVVACVAGAGLAIYGSTRVWSVEETVRPGLSTLRSSTTGASHAPWLIGLALVALAGGGALLATRGLPRRLLGILLALVGAGVATGAVVARAGLDPGSAGAGATFGPVAGAVGGALIVVGGLITARRGHRWPAMGSRYERKPAGPRTAATSGLSNDTTAADDRPDTRALWDALDQGQDPTTR